MQSPYEGLESRSFWRSGVAEARSPELREIYRKKFSIEPGEPIATAGSCFAQHIARRLRAHGHHVIDVEPAPEELDAETAMAFGFNLYSARYGNIYTVRQMLQLVYEAIGLRSAADGIWERDGRYFDALRPAVEPIGLAKPEFVVTHRQQHLERVALMLVNTKLFVFTLGLTEAWVGLRDGTVFPTAPGTIAGDYDSREYGFKNFTYTEIVEDFLELRTLMKRFNGAVRFILTVSPVPLTATAGPEHVLAATTYSKSVLRAAAGFLATEYDDIDYFPAYEIIATGPSRNDFYESNLRTVSADGVEQVMRAFFDQHSAVHAEADQQPESGHRQDNQRSKDPRLARSVAQRVQCEEEILDAFSK